jgi:hypothetical protein
MAASSPDDEPKVEWVTEAIIRQIFNERRLYEDALSGRLITRLKRSSHPADPTPAGQPICTWSQIVYYYDQQGKPLAIVHQFLRPDGTLGASGLPDPKRLFLDDRIISVRSTPTKSQE